MSSRIAAIAKWHLVADATRQRSARATIVGVRLRCIRWMICEDIAARPLRRSTNALSLVFVAVWAVWLISHMGVPYFDGDTWSLWSYGGGLTLKVWEPAGRPRFDVERGWLPFSVYWGIPGGNRTYAWVFCLSIAYYTAAIPLALPLVLRSFAVMQSWFTWQPGTCRHCGYDLRASRLRCPECGSDIGVPIGA